MTTTDDLVHLRQAVKAWEWHRNNLGKTRRSPQRQIARYNNAAHQAAEAAAHYLREPDSSPVMRARDAGVLAGGFVEGFYGEGGA